MAQRKTDSAVLAPVLPCVAYPEALRLWMAAAEAGGEAVYASGTDLPREASGVRMVARWAAIGLVTTHQQRDPQDERRWLFLIRKVAGACDPSPAPAGGGPAPLGQSPGRGATDTRAQMRRLLAELRRRAERGDYCPSNGILARRLGLPHGERGRARAKYLLARLAAEKRIAVESRGTCAPRVVTILAPGRAQGRSTGS